jgi:hypothetical protein
MHTNRFERACERKLSLGFLIIAGCLALISASSGVAQAPAASGNAAQAPSPEELERLVGPIALYPDDLVAIILPASTNPLQLVQADRFLDRRKQDPNLPVDDRWDDSVKALVNYPEVVKQMSADLDWTAALGEAVVADQGAVLDAVQAFRRKAQAAGNLKTDGKQVVVVEKEVVKIVPADPQVIYVPQYNPATVVVYSAVPVYGYWPSPYPVYYYPYAPGAAFATGLIWGAAIGAAWNGGRYAMHYGGGSANININRNTNINTGNINTGNINRGNINRGGASTLPANSSTWKPNKQPGQVSSGGARQPTAGTRVGDARPASGGGGAAPRPSTQPAGGGMNQAGAAFNRQGSAGTTAAARPSGTGGANRDAFGGYASGRQTSVDSSRGAASRSSMQSGAPAAGGGARTGGGGGARGGGGGGGGGGRGGRR